MPKKILKAVIIGTGMISGTHVHAIKNVPGLSISACWNRTSDRGKSFADKHGIKYYSSIDEMLEKEQPDVTINALGQKYHLLGLEKAAELGSHLVVEKPFALSINECRGMIEISRENKVKLAVSESVAFNYVNLHFNSLRENFGETIHLIETNYRHYFSSDRNPWFFDPIDGFGGMIMNVGVHRISRMRILSGSEEISVCANVGRRNEGKPVEGDATIFIRYKNGSSGVLMMCGYHNPGTCNPNFSQVVTEKGFVNVSDPIRLISGNGSIEEYDIPKGISRDDYVNFYTAFLKSIINNEQSPYPGELGMRDIAVVLAAFKSYAEKREVTISEIINGQ